MTRTNIHEKKENNLIPNNIQPSSSSVKKTERGESSSAALSAINEVGREYSALEEALDLEHCPLSFENIHEKSLLDKELKTPFPNLIEKGAEVKNVQLDEKDVIIRLASNFLGGGLVTGAGVDPSKKERIDGVGDLSNFMTWDWLLDQLAAQPFAENGNVAPVLSKLKTGMRQLLKYNEDLLQIGNPANRDKEDLLQQKAMEYANKIRHLECGESCSIDGGWSNRDGGDGHALIYEFIKTGKKTFDVMLFTSTGYALTGSILDGEKTRLKPVVKYKDIPEDKILFSGDGITRPAFIQSLMELNVLSRWDNTFIVEEKDVLEIFDHIKEYRIDVSLSEYGAITGQRAGSCVPSSTKQWIRKQAKSRDMYKILMLKMNVQLTLLTYQKLKSEIELETPRGRMSRLLLEQLARNLLRGTKKIEKINEDCKQFIDDCEVASVVATGHDILNRVKEAENKVVDIRKAREFISDCYASDVKTQRERRKGIRYEPDLNEKGYYSERIKLPDLNALNINRPENKQAEHFLEKALDEIRLHGVNEPYMALIIDHVVDQLPMGTLPDPKSVKELKENGAYWVEQISNAYWDSVHVEHLPQVIEYLHAIATEYIRIKSSVKSPVTRVHATILPLQALIHYLSLKVDREVNRDLDEKGLNYDARKLARLENYKIGYRGLELNELSSLIFFDSHEYQRIQKANEYFNNFNDQAIYQEIFESEETTDIVKDSVEESLGNGLFWKGFLQHEKVIKIVKGESRWWDLSEEEIKEELEFQKATYDDLYEKYEKKVKARQEYLKKHNIKNDEELEKHREDISKKYGWYSLQASQVLELNRELEMPQPFEFWEPKNLPPVQKDIMVLENEKSWLGPLVEYRYIWLMRDMTYLASECVRNPVSCNVPNLTSESSRNGSPGTRPADSYFKNGRNPKDSYARYSTSSTVKKMRVTKAIIEDQIDREIKGSYRFISHEDYAGFIQKEPLKRHQKEWDKKVGEAKALEQESEKESTILKHSFFDRILRTGTEWRLTPHQMVMELKKSLEETTSSDFQEAFFRIFLRSPVTLKNNAKLGVGELIVKDDALYEQCRQLISTGLNHFGNSKNINSVDGGRFFLELAYYLGSYLRYDGQNEKAKKLCPIQLVDKWLSKEGLSDSLLSVLHFYRLLLISNDEVEKIESDALIKAYQSWAFYSFNPEGNGKWDSKILQRSAERFITKLTIAKQENLENDQNLRDLLGNGILNAVKLAVPQGGVQWEVDKRNKFPYLICEINDTQFYRINIVKGVIYNEFGILSPTSRDKEWHQDHAFIRIFKGRKNFEYRSEGENVISFCDMEFGNIRIIQKKTYSYYHHCLISGSTQIQRQFPGSNAWFEHKNLRGETGVSNSLYDDHTFWTPIDKGQCPYKGYFVSLHTFERLYGLKENGVIIEVDPKEGVESPESQHIDYLVEDDKTSGLMKFDKEILLFHDEKENLRKIKFPRYSSLKGNPLEFYEESGYTVWSENKQYHLAKTSPDGLLGTIPNYLYLRSKSKIMRDVILVPFQEASIDNVPYASAKLLIENRKSHYLSKENEGKEQWGIHHYFVYNLEGDKVMPTSQEGILFLSYLELTQKRYSKAFKLLRSLQRNEVLSAMSKKILAMLITMSIPEDHPEARAVKLHAAIAWMKDRDSTSSEKIDTYFKNDPSTSLNGLGSLLVWASEYQQGINNVGIQSRLSLEDEVFLLSRLIKEGEKNRLGICESCRMEKGELDNLLIRIKHRLESLQGKSQPNIKESEPAERHRRPIVEASTEGLFYLYPTPTEPNKYNWHYNRSSKTDSYYKSLEEARSDYPNKLETYNKELERQLAWLKEDFFQSPLPKLASRLPKGFIVNKNGPLLLNMYETAKFGSEHEKKERLFILSQWRIHYSFHSGEWFRSRYDTEDDIKFLDTMIAMLLEPQKLSINKSVREITSSPHSKKEFIKNLNHFYDKIAKKAAVTFLKEQQKNSSPKNGPSHEGESAYSHAALNLPGHGKDEISEDGEKRVAFSVELPECDSRWNELKEWKKTYIILEPALKTDEAKTFSFSFDETLLSKQDKKYEESLRRDLFNLQKDYDEGKKYSESQEIASIRQEDCKTLCDQVQSKVESLQQQLETEEKNLLRLANAKPIDERQKLLALAATGGKVAKDLSYKDCISLLLKHDKKAFLSKNPHLDYDRAVERVAAKTLQIAELKSHIGQLLRIKELSEKIGQIKAANDPTRLYLCEKLNTELDAQYHFNDFDKDEEIALRVFCGESGLIPYEKQMNLIKKMIKMSEDDPVRYKDIVIQLIMGGGKTSVLATILLYLASRREGRIGLFIVPASLYDTVKINLGESLKVFGCPLEAIDLKREDLTPYTLSRLIETLNLAKRTPLPIIMKPTTLQAIQLEMRSVSRYFKRGVGEVKKLEQTNKKIESAIKRLNVKRGKVRSSSIESEKLSKEIEFKQKIINANLERINTALTNQTEAQTKLTLLAEVIHTFSTSGDALIDEVDLILDCLQEMNFPDGDRIKIQTGRNNLLLNIFQCLTSKELKIQSLVETPTIDDVMQLRRKDRKNFDKAQYIDHVVPVISEHLAEHFEPIKKYLASYKESFIRYASGEIPSFLEKMNTEGHAITVENLDRYAPEWRELDESVEKLEDDALFLEFIDTLFASEDKESVEAANLIALTRHFLLELTPETLDKYPNKDFGLKGKTSSKVIPFLAVHSPAVTEFGYHWEEACYYYQWASAYPPTSDVVLELGMKLEEMAQYFIEKNGESYEETVEFLTCKRLFGVDLDKIKDPAVLKVAVDTISRDLNKCLEIQFETVAMNVTFTPERLTSNGASLSSMVSSRRAMSGTPWNVEGYINSLASRYKNDLGVEGRIFHELAKREEEGKNHEVELTSIENFLEGIYSNHKSPTKIRGIIETGALFNCFKSNYDVAEGIVKFLEKNKGDVNPALQGVLFFHNDPGQDQPDTLYIWKFGMKAPERIGGSSVEALRAKGLNPENYFTFYDERHTTGTDVLQVPDAINIVTIGPNMLRRTVGQGIMRLRQFLISQDVEFATTKEIRNMLFNKGDNFNDFITNFEKSQSLRKTHNMVQYFQQNINNIFSWISENKITEAILSRKSPEELAAVIERYEPFFVTKMNDEPFLQFGHLKTKIDTKVYLKKYLERKRKTFEKAVSKPIGPLAGDAEAVAQANALSTDLKKHIETATCLPKDWEDIPENLNVQQEINEQQQVEVNQQVEIEVEVEMEIDLELQRYEGIRSTKKQEEGKLSYEEFCETLEAMISKDPLSCSKLSTLKDQLSRFPYGFEDKTIPYQNVFDEPIYGTVAYFNSCKNTLPVFHKLQRPAKQVLAICIGKRMRWLLLSERETKFVKEHLERMYSERNPLAEGVWLIHPDGSPFAASEHMDPFPLNGIQDEELPIEQGLLEINAFNGNIDYLNKHSGDTEDWLKNDEDGLKVRFLKLKVARNPKQNDILRRSVVIAAADKDMKNNPSLNLLKERLEKEKNHQGNLHPESDVATKTLGGRQVKNLNVQHVPLLGIDINGQDPVTLEALKKFEKAIPENEFPIGSKGRQEELERIVKNHTKKQFENLRDYHGIALTVDQVRWFKDDLLDCVKLLKSPEQICRFEGETIVEYVLDALQIRALTDEQANLIPFVNPEYYGTFSKPWQIEKISVEHIEKIDNNFLHFLSDAQLKGVSSEQYDFLQGKIPAKRYKCFHGNLIEKIVAQHGDQITKSQISEIDNPEIIKRLELLSAGINNYTEGLWTSWISPLMIKHIDFDMQLQYLKTSAQIKEVPVDLIKKLSKEQVAHISKEQVEYLEGEEQIQNCPNTLIQYLTGDQLNFLKSEQIRFLGREQVRLINKKETFEYLSAEENSSEGYFNQMQWITEDQYQFIAKEQVKGLNLEQITTVGYSGLVEEKKISDKWREIGDGILGHQIGAFDTERLVYLLSGPQISAHLKRKQVQFLKEKWQVQHCPDKLVKRLLASQVKKISKDQVQYLEGELQIQAIPDAFFEHLSKEQLAFISDEQLELVTEKQVPGLKNDHLLLIDEAFCKHITEDQIATFDSKELVELLTEESQIQACLSGQIKFLSPAQIALIKPEQVSSLEGAEQIKLLEGVEHLIQCLAKKQFEHLTNEMYQHLSQNQIAEFDAKDKLFDEITVKQFKNIALLDVIRRVPDHLISELEYSQFSMLKNGDTAMIHQLTDRQVSLLEEKDHAVIENIKVGSVKALKDKVLKFLPENIGVLENVSSDKLQHLTVRQIRVRNLSKGISKLGYAIAGLGKTLLMPLVIVADLIVNIFRTLFSILRALFVPTALNRQKIVRELKRTFMARPLIDMLGPLELFHPAKYIQIRAKLTAAAAA